MTCCSSRRRRAIAFGACAPSIGVSFGVAGRRIVALIGPNGAGKTTVFNLIAGVYRAGSRLDSLRRCSRSAASRRSACLPRGIGRTFQIVKPFPGLSVLTTSIVGALHREKTSRARPRARPRHARAARSRSSSAQLPAAALDLPDRKRLEVARALATQPRLLCSTRSWPACARPRPTRWWRCCASSIAKGLTILLIEHVMRAVMSLAQQVLVLHHGEIIARGTPEHVVRDPAVLRVYLGTEALVMTALSRARVAGPAYGDAMAFNDVSLEVDEGEIVAIVGANGAGKTSLIRAIAGIEKPTRGRVLFRGRRHHTRRAQPSDLRSRHRPGRGRPAAVSVAHGRRESRRSARMLPRARAAAAQDRERVLRALSAPARAQAAARPARCRAASSRCWRSARCLMGAPGADHVRRAVTRARAGDRAATFSASSRRATRGHHDACWSSRTSRCRSSSSRAYVLENGRGDA